MSDVRDIKDLFKIDKKTADVMKKSLADLGGIKEVSSKLKALGIVNDKSIKQIDDLTKLTESILSNFDIET